MAEMMEQKNKLAYDKGRLQNRVGELQREVESLASGQSELAQLRKLASTTESNYKKVSILNISSCMVGSISFKLSKSFISFLSLKKDIADGKTLPLGLGKNI